MPRRRVGVTDGFGGGTAQTPPLPGRGHHATPEPAAVATVRAATAVLDKAASAASAALTAPTANTPTRRGSIELQCQTAVNAGDSGVGEL